MVAWVCVYLSVPLLLYYGLLCLVCRVPGRSSYVGRVKARNAFYGTLFMLATFVLCVIFGAVITFMYEPQEYWYSFGNDINSTLASALAALDSNTTILAYFLDGFYIFLWMLIKMTFILLFKHWSWGFTFSFAIFFYNLYNILSATMSASRIRNPAWGFDTTGFTKEEVNWINQCCADASKNLGRS